MLFKKPLTEVSSNSTPTATITAPAAITAETITVHGMIAGPNNQTFFYSQHIDAKTWENRRPSYTHISEDAMIDKKEEAKGCCSRFKKFFTR
jgi:hypothetical protein